MKYECQEASKMSHAQDNFKNDVFGNLEIEIMRISKNVESVNLH